MALSTPRSLKNPTLYKLSGPATALPTHYRGIPTRLTAYHHRRNVSVESSHLNFSSRCWHFGGFTTQGDSSTTDGLGAIYDGREGEYESCCVMKYCILTRLKRSRFIPPKAGNRIDSEWHPISRLCSKPTGYGRYLHTSFPPYPAIDLCICSSPVTASKKYLNVTRVPISP